MAQSTIKKPSVQAKKRMHIQREFKPSIAQKLEVIPTEELEKLLESQYSDSPKSVQSDVPDFYDDEADSEEEIRIIVEARNTSHKNSL